MTTESEKIITQSLEELLPEAFAVVKETARRFVENTSLSVMANEFDRQLSQDKSYVNLKGDNAIWSNAWDAAGKSIVWDMIHYDVQLIGGIVLHQGKLQRCRPERENFGSDPTSLFECPNRKRSSLGHRQ